MAKAVAHAIDDQQVLMAEAGTGTGKTFAYLVPALLWGGKTIVSTGTKNLQDQLFLRDIPTIRAALRAPVSVALLKGRSNYVCHFHLERTLQNGRLTSRDDVGHLREISRFIKMTNSGDKAELAKVPETATVWNLVTSTRDTCMGAECQYYQDCFVMKARREAQQADIVVVNHHLFFADVALKDTGVAELLPSANTIIFDEAHQLPDTATLFFGQSVSTSQVLELCRDVLAEGLAHARGGPDWAKVVTVVEKAARDLRLTFRRRQSAPVAAADHADVAILPGARQAQGRAGRDDRRCSKKTPRAPKRSKPAACGRVELAAADRGLEAGCQRQAGRRRAGGAVGRGVRVVAAAAQDAAVDRADLYQPARRHAAQLDLYVGDAGGQKRLQAFLRPDGPDGRAGQDLAEPVRLREAGLAVRADRLAGAERVRLHRRRRRRGAAGDRGGRRAHVLPVHDDSRREPGGRTPAGRICRARPGISRCSCRASAGRTELLDSFRKAGNAVLVGSQSFWEGVDVRGDALSLVIIDKLPFAPPDDPVLAARIEVMEKQGLNGFMHHQLPEAIITLKQGAGRLIRDVDDRGVLMICDPRLITKPYGRRIWQSLPSFKRTRVQEDVLRFFDPAPADDADTGAV